MGIISPTLPTVGQPNSSEDADVLSSLTTIRDVINGNLDVDNLNAATAEDLGLTSGGVTRRGSLFTTTTETTASTSYTTLTTPDQISNVVLPTAGYIAVMFRANIKLTAASGNGRAAIFLGANQLRTPDTASAGTVPLVQETGDIPNAFYAPVHTAALGLTTSISPNADHTDVTTGQIVGASTNSGPCYIFADAGTYTISIKFKHSTGATTVSVKERKLWVWTMGF